MRVPITFVSIVVGDHVPGIPFVETNGNGGATLFRHKGPITAKAGVAKGVTTTSIVVGNAHSPAPGVKVYVYVPAVFVSITAGDHVPVIPLVETVGNAGAELFRQSGPIAANKGRVFGLILIFITNGTAHSAPSGVKV